MIHDKCSKNNDTSETDSSKNKLVKEENIITTLDSVKAAKIVLIEVAIDVEEFSA